MKHPKSSYPTMTVSEKLPTQIEIELVIDSLPVSLEIAPPVSRTRPIHSHEDHNSIFPR